jgi:hypothetical protein
VLHYVSSKTVRNFGIVRAFFPFGRPAVRSTQASIQKGSQGERQWEGGSEKELVLDTYIHSTFML